MNTEWMEDQMETATTTTTTTTTSSPNIPVFNAFPSVLPVNQRRWSKSSRMSSSNSLSILADNSDSSNTNAEASMGMQSPFDSKRSKPSRRDSIESRVDLFTPLASRSRMNSREDMFRTFDGEPYETPETTPNPTMEPSQSPTNNPTISPMISTENPSISKTSDESSYGAHKTVNQNTEKPPEDNLHKSKLALLIVAWGMQSILIHAY